MKNKTECEIVEDLLLGYVDGVLNTESKKLVDKHLLECDNCLKRLNEIKNDIEENENNEKKQIDYLKKIRIKNKLKSIFMVLGIIIFILFVIYVRKFIIFNNMLLKAKQTLSSNNMYIEMARNLSNEEKFISKRYFYNEKYKKIDGILSDDGFKINSITYASIGENEKITFLEDTKKIQIEKSENIKIQNSEESLKILPFITDDRIIIRIVQPAIMSVKFKKIMPIGSYSFHNFDKTYYKFKDKINEDDPGSKEIWIDKETGLPLKIVEKATMSELFQESEISKNIRDNICEYKYEFNIVEENDVKVPSFDGYEIENKNY